MKKPLLMIFLVTLLGARLFFGNGAETELIATAQIMVPETAHLERLCSSPETYHLISDDHRLLGYLSVGEAHGYGGPLQLAVAINSSGEIIRTIIIDHKETPAYYKKVITRGEYLEHFNQKYVGDPFELEEDIDGISGATVTCRAIADAARQASHYVGKEQLGLDIETRAPAWEIELQEFVVVALLCLAITLTLITSKPRTRKYILLISTIILGFWLNRPLSITQISGALLGYFPSYYSNLLWYLIIGAGIGIPLIFGKNVFCYWLCPFGGIQELTNKVSGVNLTLGAYEQKLRNTRNVLLWGSLLVVFVTGNPNLGAYEPFGTMFGFTGVAINWLLLFIVLIASMFINRFWCKYFCPVGAFLDLSAKLNRQIKNLIKKAPPKQHLAPKVKTPIQS